MRPPRDQPEQPRSITFSSTVSTTDAMMLNRHPLERTCMGIRHSSPGLLWDREPVREAGSVPGSDAAKRVCTAADDGETVSAPLRHEHRQGPVRLRRLLRRQAVTTGRLIE
jgi:hypothetical protein